MITEAQRAYRRAHPEKRREEYRRRKARNPNKVRALDRARAQTWRENNPAAAQAAVVKWRSANIAVVRARNRERARAWRKANPDRALAANRAWALANPDKVRALQLLRNHRSCTAAGVSTAEQIEARILFFGAVCAYCGGPYEHLEHAIPLSRGGTNWPANLRPSCRTCNLTKGTKTVFEFLVLQKKSL